MRLRQRVGRNNSESSNQDTAITTNNLQTVATTTTSRRKNNEPNSKTNQATNILNRNKRYDLKKSIKKATVKFDRACKQILKLDQKINDLQNSYTNAIESDRKSFKIVYRMQLATLEGLHEAFIEYIERKVNEIRDLKIKLFDNNGDNIGMN